MWLSTWRCGEFLTLDYRVEEQRNTEGAPRCGPLIPAPDPACFKKVNAIKLSEAVLAIWQTQLWTSPWAKIFMPDMALFYEVLDHCDASELASIAAVNRLHTTVVRKYLKQRFGIMVGRFFKDPEEFAGLLNECQAVVSGSAALHLLMPPKTIRWTPEVLDILVPNAYYLSLRVELEHQGYAIVKQTREDHGSYTYSQIRQVVSLSNGKRSLVVVVSKAPASIAPIFQYHSTAAMNFVSAEHIFCAYPELTLRGLSMINPGPFYRGCFDLTTMDELRKYNMRGFGYVGSGTFGVSNSKGRTLTDSKCLWIGLKDAPYVRNSGVDLLRSYGLVDAHWVLGGRICGVRRSFAYPRLDLIADESYVCFTCNLRALTGFQLGGFCRMRTSRGSLDLET